MEFSISERYRLELHWSGVDYLEDGKAVLKGCYFSGPVLNQVMELQSNDSIDMDFVNQYYIFIESYYIAKLSWGEVKHTNNKIFLYNVLLENKFLNSIPKLNNDDYIIIDTSKHEDEQHMYNLVYTSYLIRNDGTFYDFRSMK